MKKPYFSIIIPTFNEERYLPRLLNDLKNQKEKIFEVIIVDGSSFDKTRNIVNQFNQDLTIKFFQVRKRNVSYQRNFGASKAQGQYLIFLDADCEVNSLFIKNLKNIIEKRKGLFFIPFILPDREHSEYKIIFNFVNILIEFSQNFNKPFSAGGSMVIDKHFFKQLGGFDEKLFMCEDHDLVQRAWRWGVRVKFLPNIKVRFSLRRLKKEGHLKLFYKYLIASAHYLFVGKVKNKIFDYDMGGQIYQSTERNRTKKKLFEEYLQQAKEILKKIT